MIKINSQKRGTNYLTDLYNTLSSNLQTPAEYYAIIDIIEKMYTYDTKIATKWTIELLNKYSSKILNNNINPDLYIAIYSLNDTLLIYLVRHHSLTEVIKLIHKQIKLSNTRTLLWSYMFGSETPNNIFKNYFDELISHKKYDEALKLVTIIVDNQNYIPPNIFNPVTFLNNLINSYTKNKEKIKNQQLLNMLYSLVDLIPTPEDKALLKANFINYI